jgi:hypothetical protein
LNPKSPAGSGATTAPPLDEDDMADFERLGVPREQIEAAARLRAQAAAAAAAAAEPEPPLVLARHLWPAVMLADGLRTQVRAVAGMGGLLYLGLDYARLDGVKRDLGLPLRGPKAAELFRQFRVVESEMLNVWNGQRAPAA